MELEIKRLTPDLAEDYLAFFDQTPHSDGNELHRCYCVCWAGADSRGRDFSSAEKRRGLAREYVRSGALQGYLAYANGKAVGWVNANAKKNCLTCLSWRMFMQNARADDADGALSVFCFAIAPEWRGKGVASRLLDRVCADAKPAGYARVEAYPQRAFTDTEQDFMGPISMYEKRGFAQAYQASGRAVMQKTL